MKETGYVSIKVRDSVPKTDREKILELVDLIGLFLIIGPSGLIIAIGVITLPFYIIYKLFGGN